jgi:chromosome segregation ATPase
VIQTLSDIFHKVIDEATDVTTLKTQQSAAKKKVEKRKIDFEKSKPHHEKFPATRETQALARESAEKEYSTISEKRREKEISLKSLTTQAAKTVLPSILAKSTGGADKAELQRVEKNCQDLVEKTRAEFTKLLEDQRTLLNELQKRNKALEEKHLALEKQNQERSAETKTIQEHLEKEIRPQVKDTLEKLGTSARGLQTLEQDVLELKGIAAKISNDVAQIPPNLKEQISKLDAFYGLVGELKSRPQVPANVQEQLQKIVTVSNDVSVLRSRIDAQDTWAASAQKNEIAEKQYSTVNLKIEKAEKAVQSLSNNMVTLLGDQDIFRDNWKKMDGRVKVIEGRQDSTDIERRLTAMENIQNATAISIAKGLNVFEARVSALEHRVVPIPATCQKVEDYEKKGAFQVKLSDLEELRTSLRSVEEKAKLPQNTASRSAETTNLEKRLESLESRAFPQSSGPDSSGPDSSGRGSSGPFKNAELEYVKQRLEQLDKNQTEEFKSLKQDLEDTVNIVGDIINAKVRVEVSAIDTRLSTLEAPATTENLVEKSANKAISVLKSQLPPSNLEIRVSEIHKISQEMTASIKQQSITINNIHNSGEATRHALGILTHRVDNINTADLAKYMLSQLSEIYPNVHHTDTLIGGFKALLEQMEGRLDTSDNSLRELKELAETLRTQTQRTSADPGPSLRSEVDKQEKEVFSLKSEVKKLKNATEKAQEEAGAKQLQESNKMKHEIAEQIAGFYKDVLDTLDKEVETKFKELQDSLARQRASSSNVVSPVVSHSSKTGTAPNGGFSSRVRPASSATNRQSSLGSFASDTSNKKRKLQNGQAARTNGTAPKKRRRRFSHEDIDDEEEDPDYPGDEIPQPGVSDDEE